MNKKELEKRKLVQKTVYASYYLNAVMKRKKITANKLFNFGAKRFIEEGITTRELELILEHDVLIKELEHLRKQVKEVENSIINNEIELEDLKRLSTEVRNKIISELEQDYIKFFNEYKKYYEEHPEEDIEEGFYSNRKSSISLLASRHNATEEEVKEIFHSYLIAKEIETLLNAEVISD